MSTFDESKVIIMMMKSDVKAMPGIMAIGLWRASRSSMGVEMCFTVLN